MALEIGRSALPEPLMLPGPKDARWDLHSWVGFEVQ
jgi:hypothetical protein